VSAARLVELPDGSRVLARGLRRGRHPDPPPHFGLYLGRDYTPPWEHEHLDWPDFRTPRDPAHAVAALRRTHARALAGQRVEVACGGGRGRTGTALACLGVLAGLDPRDAVAWVRAAYDRRAVETPWQKRFVLHFPR
jgi:protein-tyrosine phosphatase